ncbi:hypothetical protein [Nitrosopumilus sp.]|uniref:hypothetical protein n=1 Tax=Nitrosopumilus sp. TaxID=2024843 RepID=UPI002639A962|nr:hypothetical protein [Nitrosopumilus sp.]
MTFQKTKLSYFILIAIGIFFVGIFVGFSGYSCGVEHMLIINEISLYEKSLDPNFCEEIIEKIDLFNDTCEPEIEILDCG